RCCRSLGRELVERRARRRRPRHSRDDPDTKGDEAADPGQPLDDAHVVLLSSGEAIRKLRKACQELDSERAQHGPFTRHEMSWPRKYGGSPWWLLALGKSPIAQC